MKVWLVGAYGIVSTTAMVGARAIERGIAPKIGLVSELPHFEGIEKYAPFSFEFGGHEIRLLSNAYEAAKEHWELNRHFDREILEAVKSDLEGIVARKGTALNCGSGIKELGDIKTLEGEGLSLAEMVSRIEEDIKSFADDETVVINVASTEPLPNYSEEYHGSLEGFERMIDEDRKEYASASMLYAYAALKLGLPYANFTPSPGSAIPALKELAEKKGVPHAGNDGKTGETLVKTTLAPMFAYRNMEVVGWMSYNILGDYDGKVLSARDNKESKVLSKDKVLEKMLGYSPYSITEIQYFPSLVDNKTAFDFVHFKGFLGKLMKFYFIWDAIDAIVAAPLILDIARFLLFAKKKGVKGVVKEMAFFFKSPMDTNVINTHEQFVVLKEWYSNLK
ncbi:inositol-3-phosphate synthase [Archaeoglobus fulgidus]|uniref:Myo-inositol-1-phosphate synthase (Ino1) n=3 Tax=Archaeoglobus fulgidus TaxID=2234 RepID=O28480_ARCFU|nr:inositol-3-phosphate synthase [Archaeoglobus fulgidus]1U1I_A Chain A, myo-inositol-1-phosphate synthase [Archaeoglobus fulgidus DSM 4304]1U1I_B Chain B, myo-inositol-1-phosphate synthase [Archaeoglobus fulgidus DSM 4304]1U1I_C Chain C, myo-inositol-1-phosphate synthase [Archaeoglobus fulgidus DSM 4304]1U1I_D Chain D, myo-inositol-1-phosphate synthase [Archaeoglobus fulgidus DSM 4304]3QVS_A Chain A, Myo-inositol-1-phosphate synthase (Ino1) [Archaeoglobus fulgidus]3QVT_A Chain A, Myo-inosito